MKKLCWLLCLFFMSTTSAYAQSEAPKRVVEIAQIEESEYPTITLYVSVRDMDGALVDNLAEEQFKLEEDGEPVTLTAFSAGNYEPIATALTIDRSGSMESAGKLAGAKESSAVFVEQIRTQDQVALLTFDDNVKIVQDFTSNKELLRQGIQSIDIGECTAWYDGIYESIELLQSFEGRKSVILLSDGIDCRESPKQIDPPNHGSIHTLDEAIQHAIDADIPVYPIGFGDPAADLDDKSGFDAEKLKQVAEETGGQYYHAPDTETLKALYHSLSVELQKEYVLTYKSPRPSNDGTRRNIAITVGDEIVITDYHQKHLINVDSSPLVGLLLLLPLLALLGAPFAYDRYQERAAQKEALASSTVSQGTSLPTSHLTPSTPISTPIIKPQQPAPNRGPNVNSDNQIATNPVQANGQATTSCGHCGHEIRSGAKFCGRCGQSTVPPVADSAPEPIQAISQEAAQPNTCPRCSQSTRPGARFCGTCGLPFNESA